MCEFFSFITVNGEPKYIPAKLRAHMIGLSPDFHSVICKQFGVSSDRVNKYEYILHPAYNDSVDMGEFKIDQINVGDDSGSADRWVRAFVKTKEFQAILKQHITCNPTKVSAIRLVKFVENPSKKLQLKLVRIFGSFIEYLKNPSKEIQLAAVHNYPYAIKHIKNPCEQIQLEAIRRNQYCMDYIQKPTKKAKALYNSLTRPDAYSIMQGQ